MEFAQYTIGLLMRRDDAPALDDDAAAAVQDDHLAHLADLHASGDLLAAGPLMDAYRRGLLVFRTDADRAQDLMRADPAVRAGRFDVVVMPWMVPSGLVAFTPGRLPRSMAEATG